MEHKIIHTENYLLIVDDSKIKVGDFYLTSDNTILQCEKILLWLSYSSGDYGRNLNGLKRITSHLPLNNSPLLNKVSLLPDLPPIENSGNYTEEYMKECVMYILTDLNSHNEVDKPGNFVWIDSFNRFIESTQCLKFPTGFKSETKWIGFDGDLEVPKKLTMDGLFLWMGEYVY